MGAVPSLDVNRSRFPQRKQRKFRRGNLILADPQQNIARLHTSLEGGATGMHILENPTTSTVVLRLEKRGADGHLSRRARPLLVIEARVTDLQLLDQLIELPLKFLFAVSREDSLLPFFGQVAPIDAIQLGIVELLLTRVHDLPEHQIHLVSCERVHRSSESLTGQKTPSALADHDEARPETRRRSILSIFPNHLKFCLLQRASLVHTRRKSAIELAHQPTAEIIVGLPEIRNHCTSTRDQEWAHEI